jgi:hypothetical protein
MPTSSRMTKRMLGAARAGLGVAAARRPTARDAETAKLVLKTATMADPPDPAV